MLKANLAIKLNKKEEDPMKKFEKLPVHKSSSEEPKKSKDAVGEFLDAVNDQEKKQREA